MNKKLPLISLFIMSIITIYYFSFISDNTLYEAKWNAQDTNLAIIINGEISTTFPTVSNYLATVECTSGTGKAEWNGTKWILTTTGMLKGSTKCNIIFDKFEPKGWSNASAGTLIAALKNNNQVVSPITTPGIALSTSSEALLASTTDDYGASFYFRGAVTNNYVKFANKCWRIVRINGDGTIKLILHNDNTSSVANPCSSANNSTTAAFARYSGTTYTTSYNSVINDNAYMGFMYGTAGSSDYTATHANTNKSTILTNLETWYKNNLASYESKLADTIWCNDISTFTTLKNNTTYGNGLGYAMNQTGYSAYNRINGGNSELYAEPSLICPYDNNGGKLSKFTANDTINGNGALTYKIGLITAVELAFAGYVYVTANTTIYLEENASGANWWTISPNNFAGSSSHVWSVYVHGLDRSSIDYTFGLRPAISLISSITATGTGTSEDPYIVN